MANKGKPFSDNGLDYPRITFQTPGRTFDRLLKENSLSDLEETVRKKLGLGSGSVVQFAQLRNGQLVDLEDEEDFDAFCVVANEQRHANLQVVLTEKSIAEDSSVDAKRGNPPISDAPSGSMSSTSSQLPTPASDPRQLDGTGPRSQPGLNVSPSHVPPAMSSPRLGAHPSATSPPPPPMAAQMQPPVPWPGYYYDAEHQYQHYMQTYPSWNWAPPQMSAATRHPHQHPPHYPPSGPHTSGLPMSPRTYAPPPQSPGTLTLSHAAPAPVSHPPPPISHAPSAVKRSSRLGRLSVQSSAFVLNNEDGIEVNLETLTTKVSPTPPTPSVIARQNLPATSTRKAAPICIATPEQRQKRLGKEAKAKASAEERAKREKEEEEAKTRTSRPRVDDAADLRRISRSATTSASKLSSQLPSKSAWSKGPPQTASAPSPCSQSPAPSAQPHSRRPSALGQGVSVKDGVSVPRNNVRAVKQGTAVTFGSIDDVPAPLSTSPGAAPPVKSEGVKPFRTVPNTRINGKASVASRPAAGPSISTSSTSTSSAQASTPTVPASATPPPISKLDVRKLFQNPSSRSSNSSTSTETSSPASPLLGAHPSAMPPPPPPMAAQMQPPVPWPGYCYGAEHQHQHQHLHYMQTYPSWNWPPQMSPVTRLFQIPSSQPSNSSTSTETSSPATRPSLLPSPTSINQASQHPPPSTQSSYTPFAPNARPQQPHQQHTVIPVPVTETSRLSSNNDTNSLEVVNTNVKALLNKLTMEEFDSISDQIIQWANRSEEQKDGLILVLVIRLVYEKAIDDATWSEMYANLCKKMMEQISPNVQDKGIRNSEGKPLAGGQLFRKYLLDRYREDFKRGWFAKEVTAPNKRSESGEITLDSDEYYAAQKAKRQGLGLIKFIGELFKRQMLTERIMHTCIEKLLGNAENLLEEEDMESLCTLLTTIGSLLDNQKARARMHVYFQRMQELSKNVNPQMQFMLQDVIELRKHKWQAVVAPTTVAQVPETITRHVSL